MLNYRKQMGVDALQTAFGENPLDGEMASELLAHESVRNLLPKATVTALSAVASSYEVPGNLSYFERLLSRRDFDKIKRFIDSNMEKESANLFWRQQGMTFGLIDNDLDWVAKVVDLPEIDGLLPVATNIRARVGYLRGECLEAARLAQDMGDAFGPAYPTLCTGLCLLHEGDGASAHLMLLQSVAQTPWNTSLLLRTHDLLAGWDVATKALDGTVAVLLYSWNKEIELDATLRSLVDSDLTGASIYVLDNGSTDRTGEILKSWQGRFDTQLGPNRFEVLTLPVNIGAPAARNWLLHHPSVGEHDYICYLDDDVVLPKNWLQKLGAAVDYYPDAGVWGCKVVDYVNPTLLQSADSHLLIERDGPPPDLSSPAPNPFKLSDLHIQTLDHGLFDMVRPCASVTGCCHLFRSSVLFESGDFAIHLSPTQYDDMEHDLRLCKSGHYAVYQGHLPVLHRKRSGSASRVSMEQEGNALGNKYKMQTMHTREELADAADGEQVLLERDLVRKMRVVERVLVD